MIAFALVLTSVVTFNFATANSAKAATTPQKTYGDLKRKIVGYFPEWSYKSKEHNFFGVENLQWDSLTHIQYSFATVNDQTNKIDFSDRKAAIEETFAGRDMQHKGQPVSLDPTLPYKGHFNMLQVMKKKYPDVKILISVGGWGASRGFFKMLDSEANMEIFANSVVDFLRTYNFDGVDIDFEYYSATSQSGNPADFDLSESRRKTINASYNTMHRILREKLDAAGAQDGKQYVQSAAVTASSWVLGGVSSNDFVNYLDFVSVMSYDYHGGWNEFVENQANIYPDPADRETTQMLMPTLSFDWSYRYYRGVLPAEKILMGIPYYTRGWENVSGGTNGLHGSSKTPATGKYNIWGDDLNNDGVLEPAGANPLWHVLNLIDQDANTKRYWDPVGKVPHVWNDKDRVFLTFEDEESIDERLKYIKEKNLGGALIWVMDGDFGPNPNYVKGSTDVTKGKYTFGDTLTKRLRAGLNAMGDAVKSPEDGANLEPIKVDVKFGGTYDHPNYTYAIDVTNYTGADIAGGWELSFDLPKSSVFRSAWGATVTQKDLNDEFTRVTLKAGGWQALKPGEKVTLQGAIGLTFGGVRNLTFNGKKPVGNSTVTTNSAPVIAGANDVTINVGDTFNALAGVTATDKEDGVLTSSLVVTGTVDTTKAGVYPVVYAVKDKAGLETKVTRNVTVKAVASNEAPVITGAVDVAIKVGDTFNARTGVTAT
ncbi:MAG: glycosyl hydrolase family 18 protein, partial [Bacilli bacterium]